MKILLSSSLFTCLCTIALSQQPIWTATAPIEGGAISKVWVDSVGNIYAGTEVDGLYRSTTGGSTWQKTTTGLGGDRVTNFTVNHQGHVFVLTDFGLYRSTDNGESWSSVYGFFEAYSVLTTASGRIFVGASQDWGIGRFYRSTDNGLTWSYVDPLRYSVFYSLVINSSGYLFGGAGHGVFKSTNDGTTWDSVNTGFVGSRYVLSLAIDLRGDIYAAVYNNGVFKTTNNGTSWSQAGLAGINVRELRIAPNGFIFAAADSGVFRSTNDGSSWIQFNDGLSNKNVASIASSASSDVFAGTFGSGMFRSTNLGVDWRQSTTGIIHRRIQATVVDRATNAIYVGAEYGGGVFRSTDRGITWNTAGLQGTSVNRLAIKSSGVMFASTSSRILRSTNKGVHWMNTNFPERQLTTQRKVAFTPTGNVFTIIDSSIYRSINDGQTWTQTNNNLSARTIWDIAVTNNGFLLVIVTPRGETRTYLSRSTDDGNSWNLVGGITLRSFFSVGTSPTGEVYVANDSVFRSTNNGETFSFAGVSFPQRRYVDVLAFNSAGHIFAATYLLLVSRSTNGGLNWESYNSGIVSNYVSDMTADNNNILYAATDRGVFRTLLPTTSIESSPQILPNEFVLHQNYPNPFNPETIISFDLPKNSFVTLKIFNLIGQEVATIVNAQLEAGTHTFKVGREKLDLSSGVYLYRLHTDDFIATKKLVLLK